MKRRILVIAVALVMMLTLMIPVQLQAKSVNTPRPQPQQFSAIGWVYIPGPGQLTKSMQFGSIMYTHQEGEVVSGFIEDSNWNVINGAEILIVHSADTIANMRMGTFIATASGTITLKLDDENGTVLSGSYQALIYGNFTGPNEYTVVYDKARWDLGGVAQGNADAILYPYMGTLAGDISMSGTHR
jgi:hypothetical protein